MRARHPSRSGFTLIEMSIVIVIIGLLIGGVLVGKNLLRGAEVQSVMQERERYIAAGKRFKEKYFYAPGDFPTAVSVWGAAGGTGSDATCYAATTTSQATCNGNGDGGVLTADSGTTDSEIFHFWVQLAAAGLVQGQYSGVKGAGGIGDAQPGTNVPKSSMTGAGWSMLWVAPGASDTNYFTQTGGNILFFGKASGTTNGLTVPALTGEEALNIDRKIDDGMPATGIVMTYKQNSTYTPLCATTTNPTTAAYNLTQSGMQCILEFSTGL